MVDPNSKKSFAPEGPELSDAIGLVLKDHNGPVNVANVAKKLKAEHPTWKLPERRVKKFIKKYESENQKSADAAETPTDKRSKMFSSPSKSIRRLFSSKSKKKVAEELDTDSDAQPLAEEVPEEPDAPEDEVAAEEEEPAPEEENPAYVTENESVESPQDCFTLCTIM